MWSRAAKGEGGAGTVSLGLQDGLAVLEWRPEGAAEGEVYLLTEATKFELESERGFVMKDDEGQVVFRCTVEGPNPSEWLTASQTVALGLVHVSSNEEKVGVVRRPVSLNEVLLTPENIHVLLNDREAVDELMTMLPENIRDLNGLKAVLASSEFKRTGDLLSKALYSGDLPSLATALHVQPNWQIADPVEALIAALSSSH